MSGLQFGLKMGGGNKSTLKDQIDPKATALATLGIVMGGKSMRNLRKQDINEAFLEKLYESERR